MEPCRRKGFPQISVSGQIRQQPQPSLQPSAVLSYKDRQLISTTYCFQQNLPRLQSESCGLQTILWTAVLPETQSNALIIHACHFASRPNCAPPQQFLICVQRLEGSWLEKHFSKSMQQLRAGPKFE